MIIVECKIKSSAHVYDSDFNIELPEAVTLLDGTRFYVTKASLCHSWWSVKQDGMTSCHVIASRATRDTTPSSS